MTTIKNIIYNLRNQQNQEFDIFNNKLDIQFTLTFEFINNDIYMMVNNSTLTGIFFESLKELELHLKNSFISDKNYKLY